jgi:chromosome segregation ATPase
MFDIFKFKEIKMKKEELEKENSNLLEALTRANNANRELNDALKKVTTEYQEAVSKVRELDSQLRMAGLQKQSREKFNDDSRNY